MDNLDVNDIISKGIDYIEPTMFEYWGNYVLKTIEQDKRLNEVIAVLELLEILDKRTEDIKEYLKQYSKNEFITALLFSAKFKEYMNNEYRDIHK